MGNITKRKGIVINVKSIDQDWKLSADGGVGPSWSAPPIESVQFYGGAAGDVLCLKATNSTGTILWKPVCETAKYGKVFYMNGGRVDLFIDFSECTLSTGHLVVIQEKSLY